MGEPSQGASATGAADLQAIMARTRAEEAPARWAATKEIAKFAAGEGGAAVEIAVGRLAELVADEDQSVRLRAIASLNNLVPVLVPAQQVRLLDIALGVLASNGGEEANRAARLVVRLAGRSADRQVAVRALIAAGRAIASFQKDVSHTSWDRYVICLRRLDPASRSAVISALCSDPASLKGAGLRGTLSILQWAEEKIPDICAATMIAAAHAHAASAEGERGSSALEDLGAVAYLLPADRVGRLIPSVLARADDEDQRVREASCAAAGGLWNLVGPVDRRLLQEAVGRFLGDPGPAVRAQAAATALWFMASGEPEAAERLYPLVKAVLLDPTPGEAFQEREGVFRSSTDRPFVGPAMNTLGGQLPKLPPWIRADLVETIFQGAASHDAWVRVAAAAALHVYSVEAHGEARQRAQDVLAGLTLDPDGRVPWRVKKILERSAPRAGTPP